MQQKMLYVNGKDQESGLFTLAPSLLICARFPLIDPVQSGLDYFGDLSPSL
jgi:hypothetical protein